MSRYTGPKVKLSRREGIDLFETGNKAFAKRNYPPGIHGVKGKARLTPYGKQLREKQKVKRIYGLTERQFSNNFKKAAKQTGNTVDNLVRLLEMRLDNVVYRMGLAASRPHARQMVSHGFIHVNGKTIDIPSYEVRLKDVISVKETKKKKKIFENIDKKLKKHEAPSWIHFEPSKLEGKITGLADTDGLKALADMNQIIEFYSR